MAISPIGADVRLARILTGSCRNACRQGGGVIYGFILPGKHALGWNTARGECFAMQMGDYRQHSPRHVDGGSKFWVGERREG
jgi:hypothetical protein